jgi:hypothetical protein
MSWPSQLWSGKARYASLFKFVFAVTGKVRMPLFQGVTCASFAEIPSRT